MSELQIRPCTDSSDCHSFSGWQQQLAIDVLERRCKIESEINEDNMLYPPSEMASESGAAKQTLQMTLEETEMCHAHELRCMAARNEIALLRQERMAKERQLEGMRKEQRLQDHIIEIERLFSVNDKPLTSLDLVGLLESFAIQLGIN